MKISKKILSILLSVIILITASINCFALSKEEIISQKEKDIEQLEAEIEQYKKEMESLKDDESKQEEYIETLQKQIDAYNEEIKIINEQIDDLNSKIATLDGEIESLETQIETLKATIEKIDEQIAIQQETVRESYQKLSERLCAAYMAGETSVIEIFLSSKDFSDFIERTELVYQISKHDTALVEDLKQSIKDLKKMQDDLASDMEELNKSEEALRERRAEIESSKSVVVEKKTELDQKVAGVQSQIDKINQYIGKLNQQSEHYQKLMAQADAEKEKFRNEIDTLVNNVGSTGSGQVVPGGDAQHNFEVSTMGIICPLQNIKVAVREYSWNHAKRGNHNTAMDLGSYSGSSEGKPIYSVADGKVIKASYDAYSGNYILIDHGNGVVTYYGHCSSMIVGAGSKVQQGQVIGYVGHTGYVTGPHLHFEIRVNGKQVTPENYLRNSSGGFISPINA